MKDDFINLMRAMEEWCKGRPADDVYCRKLRETLHEYDDEFCCGSCAKALEMEKAE